MMQDLRIKRWGSLYDSRDSLGAGIGGRALLPFLLLAAGGPAALLPGQSVGSLAATGNMTVPRELHSATLLRNGKVLIAGGRTRIPLGERTLASAELYDPATGRFTPTGLMNWPRRSHSATLLPDGKVLIVGGYASGASPFIPRRLDSAELYDPVTETFTPTGGMRNAHVCHSATLLGNGKVLIAGDSQDVIGHSAIAELYDASSGTFAAAAAHADPPGDSPLCPWSALLPDGRVLIASGCSSAELYDPAADAFTPTGRPSLCTENTSTAVVLANGKVLAAGSERFEGGPDNRVQLYDPESGAFSDAGVLITVRSFLTATALPDGTALIAGSHGERATAELYDAFSGSFQLVGSLVSANRDLSTATLLADGSVLIAGGPGNPSAEIYRPPPGAAAWSEINAGLPGATTENCSVIDAGAAGNVGLANLDVRVLAAARGERQTLYAAKPRGVGRAIAGK